MKIKFNTDDNIPQNKIIYLPTITITITSITKKDDTYYLQIFLDVVCMNYKMLEYDKVDISQKALI